MQQKVKISDAVTLLESNGSVKLVLFGCPTSDDWARLEEQYPDQAEQLEDQIRLLWPDFEK